MNKLLLFFKELFKPIYLHIKKSLFITNFRVKNRNNSTFPINIFNLDNINIGNKTYGNIRVIDYNGVGSKLYIGTYCSIAEEVVFLLNGEHNISLFSSYPFYNENNSHFKKSKGDIIIEDDVWIGYGTLILSGVTIGQGSVISAGSIVSKDIPPYSIYIKDTVYRKRFNEEIVSKLMTIDFSKIDEKLLFNDTLLSQTVDTNNIDLILTKLNKKENNE